MKTLPHPAMVHTQILQKVSENNMIENTTITHFKQAYDLLLIIFSSIRAIMHTVIKLNLYRRTSLTKENFFRDINLKECYNTILLLK